MFACCFDAGYPDDATRRGFRGGKKGHQCMIEHVVSKHIRAKDVSQRRLIGLRGLFFDENP